MSDDEETICVKSQFNSDQGYSLVIEYGQDLALPFNARQATAYASELFRAAAYADYDAVIVRQMVNGMKGELNNAAEVIQGLREYRPALNLEALRVITVNPGVSMFTREPFLHCKLTDKELEWQWEPDEARDHASSILEASHAIELDALYKGFLVDKVGLSNNMALGLVRDLLKYR